ncbi:hypothetical protein [Jeongeupia naejangsanensis]|uniref:hypothetical protein n=1 Tax=Jeongeupia naejangsanensis TaxID=613195 RepID=UPI0019400C6B|nr:hypothetical protein [Jeongeupia naejangsanensis]
MAQVEKPVLMDFHEREENIAFSIGRSLEEFRRCAKKNQKEMAACFDVSVGQYRKYEAGVDIPKTHAVARWSAITGAPMPLLLKYTDYAGFFPEEEMQCIAFFGYLSKASDRDFYAVLSLLTGKDQLLNYIAPHDEVLDGDLAVADVCADYYYRVSKNLEAMRQFHRMTKEEMSAILGVTCTTYNRYITRHDQISLSFLFYARAHAALRIKTSWADTGRTFYALVNRRRIHRISLLNEIFRHLNEEEKSGLMEMLHFFGERRAEVSRVRSALADKDIDFEGILAINGANITSAI